MVVETSSTEVKLAMEEEGIAAAAKPNTVPRRVKKLLLVINCIILGIGNTGSPLIMRLYFVHGGSRVWLISWLETAAWPLILLPLAVSYMYRRRRREGAKMVLMKPFLLFASAGLGILTGMDNYIYAYGIGLLPVSTSSLIIATQLAFTAIFAFLLVNQRFTWYSVNSVFLLTVGAAVLGLHSGNDRPEGESNTQYMLGFGMTLGAAALYGFILPLVELTYRKAKQVITYTLVLEMQLVLCIFATAFCTVGMLINKDFQAITREAKEFEIGESNYYLVLAWNAIILQCFFLGAVGVVFCASSLFSGVLIAVLLPVTEILAIFFFKEKFQAEKAISLILSFWGFISYFYGEMKMKNNKQNGDEDEDRNRLIIPATELHDQSVP